MIKHIVIKKKFNINNTKQLKLDVFKENNKNFYQNKTSKHYNPSVKEWHNSTFRFNKYEEKLYCIKNNKTYELLDNYFNTNNSNYYNFLSMIKMFIGKPEIKDYNNKVKVNVYIYNRQIIYLLKHLFQFRKFIYKLNLFINKNCYSILNRLVTKFNSKSKFNNKKPLYLIKLRSKLHLYKIIYKISINIIKYFNIIIPDINIYKKFNVIKLRNNISDKLTSITSINKLFYLGDIKEFSFLLNCVVHNPKLNYICIYLYKYVYRFCIYFLIMKNIVINIDFNKYKFNTKSLLLLKNILSKLYNKKVQLNIINLKYLHLDSNILAISVTRKLKDRNNRVLKVIRMAIRLSKKPYISEYYTHFVNTKNVSKTLSYKLKLLNNLAINMRFIQNSIHYKSRLILFYLSNKIISGIKLQGKGRLTKRLTASRAITKDMHKGSLKNRKSSLKGLSTTMLKGYVKSNLQYTNINSYNLIGSYGIKSWISNY